MGLMNGTQYRASLDDGREVWIGGERVPRVTAHPAFAPMIETIARIYDLHFDPKHRDVMTFTGADGAPSSRFCKRPTEPEDVVLRRRMTSTVLQEISPVIDRFGDETVSPLFVLHQNKELLDRFDRRFHKSVVHWLGRMEREHLFMSSGNTDPKGERSKQPHQQRDPDHFLRVVEEREDGLVINGAKFETGAAYAHVAFLKPTVGQWTPENAAYAISCIVPMNAPGVKHICRPTLARRGEFETPLSSKFDEIDTLIVFENVFVPWSDVLFYNSPELAGLIRNGLSTWGGHDFLVRASAKADLLVGVACLIAEQTQLSAIPAVREKIATVMVYAQAIHSFILASEAACELHLGLYRPNQALQNAGRFYASTEFNKAIQTLRDLGGGSSIIAPDWDTLTESETGKYVQKYFRIGDVEAVDRIRAMNLLSELTTSSFGGRMQLYQMFAEGPAMAQAALLYNTYDRERAVAGAKQLAGIGSDAERLTTAA